jgi:hypothetical protein
MVATMRRIIVASLSLCFFGGAAMGFLAATDFNFDRHSYIGGVEYVMVRLSAEPWVTANPVDACQMYVDAGMNEADGFPSEQDFLDGCRDAYERRAGDLSTGLYTAVDR